MTSRLKPPCPAMTTSSGVVCARVAWGGNVKAGGTGEQGLAFDG
jgi:hypothetical protein